MNKQYKQSLNDILFYRKYWELAVLFRLNVYTVHSERAFNCNVFSGGSLQQYYYAHSPVNLD